MRKYIMLIISLINAAAMAAVIAMSETDIVPTHYNISGTADRYSSKWTFMLAAAIPAFLYSADISDLQKIKQSKRAEQRQIRK